MSCNYYAIPKISDRYKEEIIKAVKDGDLNLAMNLFPEKIHIGKHDISGVFLFNHNDWEYFEQTELSIREFIGGCQIVDEYNQNVELSEFWGMVETSEIPDFYINQGYAFKVGKLLLNRVTNFSQWK